jgi:hypothetical protein
MTKRNPDGTFPVGVSGNPGGRPKGKAISTWMAEFGEMTPAEFSRVKIKNLPMNGRIALARLRDAMGSRPGAVSSTSLIQDRTEGKVSQPLNFLGPVPLNITLSDDRGADAPSPP